MIKEVSPAGDIRTDFFYHMGDCLESLLRANRSPEINSLSLKTGKFE